jgi:hypothetical protein
LEPVAADTAAADGVAAAPDATAPTVVVAEVAPIPATLPNGAMPAAVVATLRRIASLLDGLDTRVAGVLDSADGQLRPWFGPGIDALQHHIAGFEYEEASAIVRALIIEAAPRIEENA